MSYQSIWHYFLLIPLISEDILNRLFKHEKFMSKKSQNHKRQEQNDNEWLDKLTNKIKNMKHKITNTY